MNTLLANNFYRTIYRRLGVHNGVERIQNVTQSKNLYGYFETKKSEKFFKTMNLMNGCFSLLGSVANGDLLYDRHDAKYGYVTDLKDDDYAYIATMYVCNAAITIAHPNKTPDAYKRNTVDWTTTVHSQNLRALIALENYLLVERGKGSQLDVTPYYCYVPYSTTVHQGDRIYDGSRYFSVKNIDEISFNGALKIVEMVVVINV